MLQNRMRALESLNRLTRENQNEICAALHADLRKPSQESLLSEVAVTLEEIAVAKKNLQRWLKPKRMGTPLPLWPAKSRIYYEPLGLVLIIGPWNYPFQLLMAPLVGALAAGNRAVLKPSELTPNTSGLIARLIAKYFSPDEVRVVEGGIPETAELLNSKFDHIFFTGSTPVGRIVMRAASQNLTPVTLELGGKSPLIVSEDADLDLAARRIVWGKFYNAGQTCVAPDYLYVQESVEEALLERVKRETEAQFGVDPQRSLSLARIVNERHLQRLAKMIPADKIFCGGRVDASDLYVAPTVLRGVSWDDPVMQEEIFGPILPVLTYRDLDEVLGVIRSKPKPLAAYLFSNSKRVQQKFVNQISFGGGCINDVLVHLGSPHLPFGGVGESGMGRYHGRASFETFSHAKSVMYRYGFLDLAVRYAPYSDKSLQFMKRLFRI